MADIVEGKELPWVERASVSAMHSDQGKCAVLLSFELENNVYFEFAIPEDLTKRLSVGMVDALIEASDCSSPLKPYDQNEHRDFGDEDGV